jgi:hypothetical protein
MVLETTRCAAGELAEIDLEFVVGGFQKASPQSGGGGGGGGGGGYGGGAPRQGGPDQAVSRSCCSAPKTTLPDGRVLCAPRNVRPNCR